MICKKCKTEKDSLSEMMISVRCQSFYSLDACKDLCDSCLLDLFEKLDLLILEYQNFEDKDGKVLPKFKEVLDRKK